MRIKYGPVPKHLCLLSQPCSDRQTLCYPRLARVRISPIRAFGGNAQFFDSKFSYEYIVFEIEKFCAHIFIPSEALRNGRRTFRATSRHRDCQRESRKLRSNSGFGYIVRIQVAAQERAQDWISDLHPFFQILHSFQNYSLALRSRPSLILLRIPIFHSKSFVKCQNM